MILIYRIITGVLVRNESLLSAELGLIFLVVVCGVGIFTLPHLVPGLRSELDFLETSKRGFGGGQPPINKINRL